MCVCVCVFVYVRVCARVCVGAYVQHSTVYLHVAIATSFCSLLYPDSFPSVAGVTGSPVKNSSTIQVSWTVPGSSCYRFDQFLAKCTPVDGGATGEASVSSQDGEVAMSVDVGGLMSHTLYQCEVTTTLTDARTPGIAFDHMTTSDQTSTFTFPSGRYSYVNPIHPIAPE